MLVSLEILLANIPYGYKTNLNIAGHKMILGIRCKVVSRYSIDPNVFEDNSRNRAVTLSWTFVVH